MKWMGGVCCLGLSPENRFLKTDFLKLSLLGWSCNPRKWKPPGKHSALQGATQRPLRCPTAFGTACVVPKIMGGGHCSVFLLREGGVMSQRLIWTFFMLVIFHILYIFYVSHISWYIIPRNTTNIKKVQIKRWDITPPLKSYYGIFTGQFQQKLFKLQLIYKPSFDDHVGTMINDYHPFFQWKVLAKIRPRRERKVVVLYLTHVHIVP